MVTPDGIDWGAAAANAYNQHLQPRMGDLLDAGLGFVKSVTKKLEASPGAPGAQNSAIRVKEEGSEGPQS